MIVALLLAFLSAIRREYRKPVLITEFDNKEPFCIYSSVTNPNTAEMIEKALKQPYVGYKNIVPPIGYFLRLRVKNVGRSMARDCEAKLLRILDAKSRVERTDFDPTNLHWAGHGRENTISIYNGAYEYLEFVFVRDDNLGRIFVYTTEAEPRALVRTPGDDFIFHIALFGKNIEPIKRCFELHVGSAFEKDGYDNISLKEIPCEIKTT